MMTNHGKSLPRPKARAAIPLLSFALTSLVGCDRPSEAELAVKRYELVKQQGDADETCAAAHEVEAAYLRALNHREYQYWAVHADVECMTAQLDRLG